MYLKMGIKGIRGEVAAGLPAVADIALPQYRKGLARGFSPNDASAITLVYLISQVEDTNLYHRGGPEGAARSASAGFSICRRS